MKGVSLEMNKTDNHLKNDHFDAQVHILMMVKILDLFGFINDLEKIIYGAGFKLILKGNSNNRA